MAERNATEWGSHPTSQSYNKKPIKTQWIGCCLLNLGDNTEFNQVSCVDGCSKPLDGYNR